jgi:hypothetical protein
VLEQVDILQRIYLAEPPWQVEMRQGMGAVEAVVVTVPLIHQELVLAAVSS